MRPTRPGPAPRTALSTAHTWSARFFPPPPARPGQARPGGVCRPLQRSPRNAEPWVRRRAARYACPGVPQPLRRQMRRLLIAQLVSTREARMWLQPLSPAGFLVRCSRVRRFKSPSHSAGLVSSVPVLLPAVSYFIFEYFKSGVAQNRQQKPLT